MYICIYIYVYICVYIYMNDQTKNTIVSPIQYSACYVISELACSTECGVSWSIKPVLYYCHAAEVFLWNSFTYRSHNGDEQLTASSSKTFTNLNKSGFTRRNTLGCLDQYAVYKIVNMLDSQSHHNPQPKRSSSSGTLNMIPPWNIHTVKQSMPRSCSNGCSLNWLTPSEFFQFSQLTN